MQRGSSLAGRLTWVLTEWAVMWSAGYETRGTSSPASQASQASAGRMTGMRPCTGATVSLAAVVRIVQVSTTSPGTSPRGNHLSPQHGKGATVRLGSGYGHVLAQRVS